MGEALEKLLETLEIEAMDRRDLQRAIRYNWIRNAYKSEQLNDDTVVTIVQHIHYYEPKEWPKLHYGGRDHERTNQERERPAA